MKKIGTITFHASYNHGSCLQAFALQRFVEKILNNDCDYKIINLRTSTQKKIYSSPFELYDIKSIIKRFILLGYKKKIKIRENNYEKFLVNNLKLTKEYSTLEELKNEKFNFDYYISGSDQLWNLNAHDFDWANFLEFTNNKNKISYAASFGPLKQNWSKKEFYKIRNLLEKYKTISVREEGSAVNVRNVLGIEPTINVDPTLLIEKNEWDFLITDRIIEGKYIFLYDVKGLKDSFVIAKAASKYFNLPVVIVKENVKYHINNNFIKKYESGPCEFLNLIKNSELVLSSSFHGTIFSLIFEKPFYAINGDEDLRISNILKGAKLDNRTININDFNKKFNIAFDINFDECQKYIVEQKKKSKEYLLSSLDVFNKED